MKAKEVFDLAKEIANMQKKEEKPMPRRRAPRNMKHFNKDEQFVQKLHWHLDQADLLKQVLEDRQKAHKKDEKKEEEKKKHGPSLEQVMIMLVGSYPIIGLIIWYFAR